MQLADERSEGINPLDTIQRYARHAVIVESILPYVTVNSDEESGAQ